MKWCMSVQLSFWNLRFVVLFGSMRKNKVVDIDHCEECGCYNAQDDGSHIQHNGGALEASVTSACWFSTFL